MLMVYFLLVVHALGIAADEQTCLSGTCTDAQTIFLVRHGQAYHNIANCNDYPDPHLTSVGMDQVSRIRCSLRREVNPDLVIYSPLRRTIETMMVSFGDVCTSSPTKCLAVADLQENYNGIAVCDTGSMPASLQQQYPSFDFSHLADDWMTADAHLSMSNKLHIRHTRVKEWLAGRSEQEIAVVAHHGTIRGLIGIELKNAEVIEVQLNRTTKEFIHPVKLYKNECVEHVNIDL